MDKEYEVSKPIYMQIAEKIFRRIIRQEIKPGDKLPSVREMAIQAGVNPNTIQRTYMEMERMGIVETRRGQGTFVVERQEIVDELMQTMQKEIIGQFVKNMMELGLGKKEIVKSLEEYLERGEDK
ncbi:MAG: GntR family transcriptional regulator [Caldibacillus debilis]|uniref:GntR family transcriptional regulator n=2 Tax=Caldibacillus debilis TaxID=301148 RepID=A0A3E0K800_9BACI|nr:GntR family transcriptional regulator [Caldibacillus debilis]MBO2482324.1 GntR family transcriptional regulator [Bacillaceae bacterium]MBY6271446.1 GntR family transcriptional regulator [Bacillaceae bacterium]OUM88581.1 MAG: GntR family transcriptional regulator [Caldibacillus debilis]REJ18800.1 MAG: GntR family transcriptional regulator [Caldibacillus debilis]REJ29223.1 MAG: GntR family transcriptional regulator [Caldibacillus debilis]